MTKQVNLELLEQVSAPSQGSTSAYRVTNADNGTIEPISLAEASLNPMAIPDEHLPYPRDARGRITVDDKAPLLETSSGTMSTANFPELLRQGVRFDSLLSYRGVPTTWPLWCAQMGSNKQKEQWLKDAGLGIPPVVNEGEDLPYAALDLDSSTEIENHKYGYILRITDEMRRFDQVGKVRQISQQMGRSFAMGEEAEAYKQLTTAGNYTRTVADNDVGNNTAATTFSPTGLITALTTLATMKDQKSGAYLGVMPNTLLVTPLGWMAAKQLINSPQVMRAHADDDSTVITVEKYGTGTTNSFFDLVDTIIVSPWLGASYEWVLMERQRAMMFQRVYPFDLKPAQYAYEDDTWHYPALNYYGIGMLDDRFAYYSSSATAPTVD